jgi:hypothetical protein
LAHVRDFDNRLADAVALAQPDPAAVEPRGGDVLAQGARVKREALGVQLLDALGGDQQQRFPRPAVNVRMAVSIAGKAHGSQFGAQDRALGDAARRGAHLQHAA